MSVYDFSSVPLSFGFLPPISQEGLLIIPYSLKLSVRMLWARGGHFFWTYNFLKCKREKQINRKLFTYLQFYSEIHWHIPLLMSVNLSTFAPCNSAWTFTVLLPPSQVQAVSNWEEPELNGCGRVSVANTSKPHTTHCCQKTTPSTPSSAAFTPFSPFYPQIYLPLCSLRLVCRLIPPK